MDETEHYEPFHLIVQVWDADLFSSDDFTGTLKTVGVTIFINFELPQLFLHYIVIILIIL